MSFFIKRGLICTVFLVLHLMPELLAASANADLSSLTLSAGTLAPPFASGTTSYATTVPSATNSLTVTPTVADPTATVTVNGVAVVSGNASGAITLSVGTNTITTLVTAQDGTTTKTYSTSVSRPAFVVTVFTDSASGGLAGTGVGVAGDLRKAMLDCNAAGGTNTITFSGSLPQTITLSGPLPPVTSNLTIDGGTLGDIMIDGANLYRVFFVDTGTVTLTKLQIQNGTATGGRGGNLGVLSGGGGGGGAGLGAGVFVNQATANVTVTDVYFIGMSAVGGAGGKGGNNTNSGGGGGGLAFPGGDSFFGGGGTGGGGVTGPGVDSPSNSGGTGGPGGGGGGGFYITGSGGTGGAAYATNNAGSAGNTLGGTGGFGGGGGGSGVNAAGVGGFGGGGGSNGGTIAGAVGGPGGGGGGAGTGSGVAAGGTLGSGVTGGSSKRGGGGGAAAGPAIFVRSGTLTTTLSFFSTATSVGGGGGTSTAAGFAGVAGTSDSSPVFNYGGNVNGSATLGPIAGALPALTPTVVSPVAISSNGTTVSTAKVGDIVTVAFTSTRPSAAPSVTIDGHVVTPVNLSANNWTASYTLTGGDPAGLVTFNITSPSSGGYTGTTVSTTTDASSVTADTSLPTVSTLLRQSPATVNTTANSITWRATFSEAVTGVDATDFTLTVVAGTATGTIGTVTPISPSVYDVAVTSVAGIGRLRLDLNVSGTGIADLTGNAIGSGGFTTGEFYLVGTANVFDTVTLTTGTTRTVSNATTSQVAQRFTTAAGEPLTLARVSIALGTVTGLPSPIVTINADSAGVPGAVVATLTNPTSLTANALNVWTTTGILSANTTYWIVAADTSISGAFEVKETAATSGGSGSWLTGSDYVYRYGANAGTGPQSGALLIALGAGSTPVVTSTLAVGGTYGTAFTYTIIATNSPTSYGATGLPSGLVLNPGTGTITGSPTQSGVFNVSLTGVNGTGTGIGSTLVLTVTAAPLTVTANSDTRTYGAANPTLSVAYSGFLNSDSAASLSTQPTVTTSATGVSPVGAYPMTASGGVSNNYTFTYVAGTLAVTQAPLTVTANSNARIYGASNPALSVTYGGFLNSDSAGSLTTQPTAVTSATGTSPVGTYPITASGGVSNNYGFTYVAGSLAVTPATAIVTLSALAQTYDGSPRSVTVTTAPAGLSVGVVYNGASSAPINAGSYAVVATVNDPNYQGSASNTLTIGTATQTITFAPVGPVAIGSPVTLSATASSGLPATYSIVSGNATLSGSALTVNDSSAVTVRATQSGNSNYPAAFADQTVSANPKLPQTIIFTTIANKLPTDPAFALNAIATSSLPVSFTVQSGPATVSGSTATLSGSSGTVTIVAHQAGDSVYLAAPDVTSSFLVTAPGTLVYFGTLTDGSRSQGDVAAYLPATGASTLIGFLPGQSAGFVASFTPDAGGGFVVAATPIRAQQALSALPNADVAAAFTDVAWTIRGQVSGNTLTGTIDQLVFSFAATADPVSGPTAGLAGYYVSASLDTTNGSIYTMVGTMGDIYILSTLPDLVVGGSGLLTGGAGNFTMTSSGALNVVGILNTVTATVDGAIVRPSGRTTNFSGRRADTARTDRLINLSSRARVGPGDNLLITGFVIGGTLPKSILLRAVGPTLALFNVPGAHPNPRIRLVKNGAIIAENDDWSAAANATEITALSARIGAFSLPSGSRDAALLVTLDPGPYTALIDATGGVGIALAEIYDASENPSGEFQRLVNISARGVAAPGDGVLIGGFIVTGNSPKRILVRGIGPALAPFGVAGVLADPRVAVLQGGTVLAQNDDWGAGPNTAAELSAAAITTGAFALPPGSKDAALLLTLAPGLYTAHVTTSGAATGVALVEIYELPSP